MGWSKSQMRRDLRQFIPDIMGILQNSHMALTAKEICKFYNQDIIILSTRDIWYILESAMDEGEPIVKTNGKGYP